MARIETVSVLDDLVAELDSRYGINASVRYSRTTEESEIPPEPAYYVEHGEIRFIRGNCASPRCEFAARVLSESSCSYDDVGLVIRDQLRMFQRIARDLMKEPRLSCGAFLLRATAFMDAPSGVSTAALADGVAAIFGGVELVYSID